MTSEISEKPAGSETPTVGQQTIDKKAATTTPSKRIEVETLATDLQKRMGTNWDKYQTTISMFLVGRLSRTELTTTLSTMLTDSKMVRMHNQLLLANLANSLRDGPDQNQSKYSFGTTSKKQVKRGVKQSSEYEKLKKDIMNLPIRERHRIKMITRDSGKQKMANSTITLTRQQLLPKIPYVTDKDKNIQGNTIEWTQDISHALNTPLSIEAYALPEPDQLKTRMLGISREHGIPGQMDKDVVEIMYHGLEAYLKNIVESAIDTARYRKRKYADDMMDTIIPSTTGKKQKITLTNEDMVDAFNIHPFLVEPSGPIYRLNAVSLRDDEYIEPKTSIDELIDELQLPTSASSALGIERRTSMASRTSSPLSQKKEIKSSSSDSSEIPDGANMGTREELNMLIYDILKV